MTDDPSSYSHSHDHSARDGIFDGSADDIEDLHREDLHRDGLFHDDRRRRGGHADLSGAPAWVVACTWLGALLAMAGMGVLFFGVLSDMTPSVPTPPTDFPSPLRVEPAAPGGSNLQLGFGLFFAGLVVSVIGALGHATTRRG
ncbi:hypothetical protein [Lentzea nigeriaca]|uniref:hypothetical protein n=1 Tax=Lentzea nigeriaca TaxID=1128665 RepID=UPI001959EB32|nr:hypothetical protein [Lentzea nigeriaca]MBM7863915.1 hypothetical protein [Lentzea nigeriaca]